VGLVFTGTEVEYARLCDIYREREGGREGVGALFIPH